MSAHGDFCRQHAPIAARMRHSLERQQQLQALAGVSKSLREAAMREQALRHAAELERLERVRKRPLDSLEF